MQDKYKNNFSLTQKLTYRAMLLTLIIVLSIFETMLPPLPFLPPGVKLGLANVVSMYALFFMGKNTAFFLIIVKAIFGFITRGTIAGALSFGGGILSILVLIILLSIFKDTISYIALSIFGAVFHNIGQLVVCFLFFDNGYIFYYLPILIISGIIMGTVTGIVLKAVLPALKNLDKIITKTED